MDKSNSKSDPMLDAFHEIEDLWMDTGSSQSISGIVAHDTLFGEPQLYARLLALEAQLPVFRDLFQGNVVSIADFAVQSGHEALAFFASRVANYVKVRKKPITDLKRDLVEAETRGDSISAGRIQSQLMDASEYFAKSIQSAFKGWFEHRAWILRSIEGELNISSFAAKSTNDNAAPATRQAARKRLHDAVKAIASDLSNVLQLVHSYASSSDTDSSVRHGLLWLDQQWKDLDAPVGDDDPTGRSMQWRSTLKSLRSHLNIARELWEHDTAGPETRLRMSFARVSRAHVKCGPYSELTYHGVLIAIARAIVDPYSPGAVPETVLGLLKGSGYSGVTGLQGVARRRVMEVLANRDWWTTMELELEREFAAGVDLPPLLTSPAEWTPMPPQSRPAPDSIQHRQTAPPSACDAPQHPASEPSPTVDEAQVDEPPVEFIAASSDFFQVSFGGTTKPLQASKGLAYIHRLLSSPGQPVHVWVLEHGVAPPPETASYMVDEPTLESVREALATKRAELDEETDPEARETLKTTINKLEGYLSSNLSKHGSKKAPRRERTECERLRETVGKAIKKALARIKVELPALHDHMVKWLKTPCGMAPCYACPDAERPRWVLVRHAPGIARES